MQLCARRDLNITIFSDEQFIMVYQIRRLYHQMLFYYLKKLTLTLMSYFMMKLIILRKGGGALKISQIAKMTGLVLDPYGIMRKKG